MTQVEIGGWGFSPLPVDTALEPASLVLPALELTRTYDLEGLPTAGESFRVPDDPAGESRVHWHSQSRMVIDVTPDMEVMEGIYDLTVTNGNGRSATLADVLAVVPPPAVTDISPSAICLDQGDVELTIVGDGFLDVDGELPTVTVRSIDTERTYTPDALGECAQLPAPATETQTCDTITITIPENDLPPGEYVVIVTNPPPADCSSSEGITIEVVPPPDLHDVEPGRICTGGGSIGLVGTGFRPGATVDVGGLEAREVVVAEGGERATASFAAGLDPGIYDATITNPDGCSSTLVDAVEVIQGPVVFWVDPPVVYNGIATQITIYGSGFSADVTGVELVPVGGGTPITLEHTLDVVRGRIQAVVPEGTPADDYDVVVNTVDCPAVLPEGLTVTAVLAIDVDAIEPGFGWADQASSATIVGSGFVSTPRAYLNPDDPAAETIAFPLESVAFNNASSLTAVVPSGMPIDTYDLIVVNPTGEVGLLEDAFTVITEAPPFIDNISPGEVDSGDVRTISVQGGNFRTPSASWSCRESDGSFSEPAGTVEASDATTATVTIDATTLSAGTVCVLRMTNADGSYADFSALAITNSSSNIAPFEPGTDMTTGRRGLSLTAGRATRAARFLYALGGDDGTEAGAYATSESAAVDIFGDLGTWFDQPHGLPGPLTLAATQRIGRFIYLVGGHDGTSAVDDVARAEILDPRDAPVIGDIDVRQGDGSGLGPGIWYYRVSAVFDAAHPTNPGGESLPSDPLVINLPDSIPDTLIVTLFFSEVADAVAYRIYRSPDPDLGTGAERMLAEVAATAPREYEDDGSAPSGDPPLPLGAHGTWVALPSLGTPRAGLGLGHAVDADDPAVHYLYAIGGVDAAGTALDTHELLSITAASDIDHTVGAAWTAGAEVIGASRSQMGIYSVHHGNAPRVAPGETFIYVVAGLLDGGTTTADAEVALVGPGGVLGAFTAVDSARSRAGFAHVAASNFLYMLGGGPSAVTQALSAEICGPDLSACAADVPPVLRNWNNEGAAALTPGRYLPGSTLESAFIFVVGGVDATDTLLSSTEQTVW